MSLQPARARLAALSVIGALLAGCAGLTPSPPQVADMQRPVNAWTGRFSATFPDRQSASGQSRASGRFKLTQQGELTMLELSGPLGQMIARAQAGPTGATLTDAEGREHSAPSAELLTERLFGWRVPLRALPEWLRGDSAGERAQAAPEREWRVRVQAAAGSNPRVLDLGWPATDNAPPRVRLRLVVDDAS